MMGATRSISGAQTHLWVAEAYMVVESREPNSGWDTISGQTSCDSTKVFGVGMKPLKELGKLRTGGGWVSS